MNDVGYLPDGTPMNRAGNAINHPAPCYPKMVENGGNGDDCGRETWDIFGGNKGIVLVPETSTVL